MGFVLSVTCVQVPGCAHPIITRLLDPLVIDILIIVTCHHAPGRSALLQTLFALPIHHVVSTNKAPIRAQLVKSTHVRVSS